jgi:hypothetical protein
LSQTLAGLRDGGNPLIFSDEKKLSIFHRRILPDVTRTPHGRLSAAGMARLLVAPVGVIQQCIRFAPPPLPSTAHRLQGSAVIVALIG